MPNQLNIEFLKSDIDFNWYESTTQNYYKEICRKKDELVRQKLTEKGFAHLIEGMDKRKFPKVCCIINGDWSYYYADNDTDEGAFIIAIKDEITHGNGVDDFGGTITFNFKWQDKLPLINYLKL